MKRIGILGGTFNPIHNGHLELAKSALQTFKLDKVIFIPTGLPPHKKEKIASKKDRLIMTRLAIKNFPKFKLSKIEIETPGYSYAVDTFKRISARGGCAFGAKKSMGKNTQLFYIMGMDSINDILSWKKPFYLFKYCDFIVATRPKSSIRVFKRIIKFPLIKINASKIHLMEMKIDISSTDIREKIRKGKSIKGLVPKAVEEYIIKNKLYQP